jgi:hypothetical protein
MKTHKLYKVKMCDCGCMMEGIRINTHYAIVTLEEIDKYVESNKIKYIILEKKD